MRAVRRITRESLLADDALERLTHEWLVTNGLGGYASGTISGEATRRYHGLLIAALAAPLGRRLMLSHLSERLRLPDGRVIKLSGEQRDPDDPFLHGTDYLVEFCLEMGLPVWRYRVEDLTIQKQVLLPHEQNSVYVVYELLEGKGPLRLKLQPSIHHRSHDQPVDTPLPENFCLRELEGRYEVSTAPDMPILRMMLHGQRQALTVERKRIPEVLYPIEENRGYEFAGALWSPGYFRVDLDQQQPAALVASTEPWEVVSTLAPQEVLEAELARRESRIAAAHPEAHEGFPAELVLAADQFIIKPVGRRQAEVRMMAHGHEVRSIIAGYHWFTDWGRDTMISLEGLTLATGRATEAADILRTFGAAVRDGLLPNLFPEGQSEGLYHTADATLWFFHAIHRYMEVTHDRAILEELLPKLCDIYDHHIRGTRFGIGVDPEDGLLRQGEEGYQLTWMDAKVDDWVVTPRGGKAVEINALWYNALCLLRQWLRQAGDDSRANDIDQWARRARSSFNRRFWYEQGSHLYDLVDGPEGDDAACRPNQILAVSLPHAVLDQSHWQAVLDVVERQLLTPVGLRSLAPGHPDYRARYYGDLRTRDAAYHQGTVWGWLIGPFVDAWLKLHPERAFEARQFLQGFDDHLNEACIGTISEIFDAEPPYTPRGCVAQAWSVAEVLRCWIQTASKQELAAQRGSRRRQHDREFPLYGSS